MKISMQRHWDLLSISLLLVQRSRMARNASKVLGGVGLKRKNENECADCYENQYIMLVGLLSISLLLVQISRIARNAKVSACVGLKSKKRERVY